MIKASTHTGDRWYPLMPGGAPPQHSYLVLPGPSLKQLNAEGAVGPLQACETAHQGLGVESGHYQAEEHKGLNLTAHL